MAKAIQEFIKNEYTSRQVPDFRVGDIVKVHQVVPDIKAQKKVSKTAKAIKKAQVEEDKSATRIQIFEGVVIARKHGKEPGATFTVRKIASHNIGVEKIFPLYSPLVKKIEVVSRPIRVRQSKLYFLRDRVGKKARRLGVGRAVEQEVTSVSGLESKEEEVENKVDSSVTQDVAIEEKTEKSAPVEAEKEEEITVEKEASEEAEAVEAEKK